MLPYIFIIISQVDTHVSPPIKRKKAEDVNVVYDRHGESMAFYKDVPSILLQLKEHPDIHVAVASRTSAPDAYVILSIQSYSLPKTELLVCIIVPHKRWISFLSLR